MDPFDYEEIKRYVSVSLIYSNLCWEVIPKFLFKDEEFVKTLIKQEIHERFIREPILLCTLEYSTMADKR